MFENQMIEFKYNINSRKNGRIFTTYRESSQTSLYRIILQQNSQKQKEKVENGYKTQREKERTKRAREQQHDISLDKKK